MFVNLFQRRFLCFNESNTARAARAAQRSTEDRDGEGRPIQERRRILLARFKEVAMRWKCPGSVPAEMFFNLACEVAGEGQTSR